MILLGNEARTLVVEGGTLVVVDNPARAEASRRANLYLVCLAFLGVGLCCATVALHDWWRVAKTVVPAAQPWGSAIAMTAVTLVFLGAAVAGFVIAQRREPMLPERAVLVVIDPSRRSARWEQTGHEFGLDRVVLRIRVIPSAFAPGPGTSVSVEAIPTLWIGPHRVLFATSVATFACGERNLVPPSLRELFVTLPLWGVAVHAESAVT